jgi:hypothetical protein
MCSICLQRGILTIIRAWTCLLGAWLLLCLWASGALAQDRYSRSESLRSIVTPALVWRFDAGASVATLPSGPAWVTLPRLGATVGVPGVGIPWRGLEFSTSLADFVVSPSPPAFGWTPQFALTQRLVTGPALPVTAEVREAFELALRVQMGVDPITRLPFRVQGSLPIVLRAPSFLRVDLTPGVGYQAVYSRGVLDVPVRVLLQPLDNVYVAAVSGISVADLSDAETMTIGLGGQLGFTVTGDFGSLVDIVVDAGFPWLFAPANKAEKVSSHQFRVMATVRFYTFWDLNATDPEQASGASQRRHRCEEAP